MFVVYGGRGMGSLKTLPKLRVGKLLNGAPGRHGPLSMPGGCLCVSSGQTGKTVKPEVYIACGISGATSMLSNEERKRLIAINQRP